VLRTDYGDKYLAYSTGCWFASVCNTESCNFWTRTKFTASRKDQIWTPEPW